MCRNVDTRYIIYWYSMSTSLSQQSQWLDQSPNVLSPISCTFVIPVTEEKNTLALNIHVHLHKRVNCRSCRWSRYLCKKKKRKSNHNHLYFSKIEDIFQKYSSKNCISKIAIDRIISRKNVEGVHGYRWWNARLSSALHSGLVDYRKYLVEKLVFQMGLPAPDIHQHQITTW